MSIFPQLPKHLKPALAAIVLVCVLAGSFAGLVVAQDEDAPDAPLAAVSAEFDPNTCGACHPNVVAAWQGGRHDTAFSDPYFQESWAALNNDPACLDCHTTGYSPATGEYVSEGVTCEACHGEAPEDHPPAPVDLNRANRVCAECHTVTQAEFRASRHEVAGLACTSCHYAHTNGLRMETELQQCMNCHGEQLDQFVAHKVHIESGLSCRDCHGYVRPGLPIPPDGLGPTGHDFQESLIACLDCHEDIRLQPTDRESAPAAPAPALGGQQAALRVSQLEAAVQTLILQNRNTAAMRMLEGGAAGLLIGGVIVWFIMSRRKKNGQLNGGQDEEA